MTQVKYLHIPVPKGEKPKIAGDDFITYASCVSPRPDNDEHDMDNDRKYYYGNYSYWDGFYDDSRLEINFKKEIVCPIRFYNSLFSPSYIRRLFFKELKEEFKDYIIVGDYDYKYLNDPCRTFNLIIKGIKSFVDKEDALETSMTDVYSLFYHRTIRLLIPNGTEYFQTKQGIVVSDKVIPICFE